MSSPFHRRHFPDYFLSSPLATLIYPLHQLLNHLRGPPHLPPPDAQPIRVVCISDTHTLEWPNIPDAPAKSKPPSIGSALSLILTKSPRTLTIYGAPQIPAIVPFGPEHAFTYPPHHDAWTNTIPPSTDILITHTPPQSHLDLSPVFSTGCPYLLSELWRVRPTLHVFGHVHAAYGIERVFYDEAQRAWEQLCASRRRRAHISRIGSLFGFVRDLFDISGIVNSARVLVYGVLGVVWARVWGGENRACGWVVNAACMYRDSGRLRNKPQVVVL
ncbi:hypothetical protein BO94DRAFT_531892 [Aspergillus sclerotioniger CBS 115572]|uniref:Calcineurin-like phosphoesterase domain-containing protein n=1 Tax=Aspergillus sclerotioniger CBS 115572 TaxID=1450535 RepID=A0A317X5Q3_9EURO|nr:hypothetical protein BO94DRAFT_531892 [Aspergillus sclerotioniger CBS 115572]PWY93903.1 hypothetical protein BO94DRAFT_531892 [Aspergillus sclerotioniger CBS 115572]